VLELSDLSAKINNRVESFIRQSINQTAEKPFNSVLRCSQDGTFFVLFFDRFPFRENATLPLWLNFL
jgi:hypothetical protein